MRRPHKKLADEALRSAYIAWINARTPDWLVGLDLMAEASTRGGIALTRENFLDGLRRIIEVKPTLIGREEQFVPKDFIIPIEDVKEFFRDAKMDSGVAAPDWPFLSSTTESHKYRVPLIESLGQFDEQISLMLKDTKPEFKAAVSGRIIVFGSCFAINVGRWLKERGRSVYTLVIAEDVNSTFNNLQLLKRVFLNIQSPLSDELEAAGRLDFDQLKQEFRDASGIIFTLGNIFHLESQGVPVLYRREGSDLITEEYVQTVTYLREMLELLRAHTTGKLLVSVSPIPISGYRGHEFRNAIEADCLSKSQLRSAIHECRKSYPGVTYIPTFEIVRWLSAHASFASFGTDDGNPRHVSEALIDRVMECLTN